MGDQRQNAALTGTRRWGRVPGGLMSHGHVAYCRSCAQEAAGMVSWGLNRLLTGLTASLSECISLAGAAFGRWRFITLFRQGE